jgi:acetyl/propionyl-CoA carboxylase alpha subunit
MFSKLLIAHHGESALRVARTCERLSIATVAIYAEVDAAAAHATTCNAAVCTGADASSAYSDARAIIDAAKAQGAEAIHPAGGVLARDLAFARAVAESGLALVGCPITALERFVDIQASRALAVQAGVRMLPSAVIALGERPRAADLAQELGLPLRVLSQRGELALAEDEYELESALERAARDGESSVTVELALERPRALSVQVAADATGACVALGDVEHSIALPPYGLIDEAPAPAFSGLANAAFKRQTLWSAATAVASEAGLVGLASVEFLLDAKRRLYFVRVVPGLPPEHALTEIASGFDLVEAQLRIAAGEPLPPAVRNAQPSGHALLARVYSLAEGPATPETRATVTALRWPVMPPGTLRIESELAVGGTAAIDRDPLLAKIITYGQTRHQAVLTLDRVLAEATIEPIRTNIDQLREILADESYRAGQYDVDTISRLFPG